MIRLFNCCGVDDIALLAVVVRLTTASLICNCEAARCQARSSSCARSGVLVFERREYGDLVLRGMCFTNRVRRSTCLACCFVQHDYLIRRRLTATHVSLGRLFQLALNCKPRNRLSQNRQRDAVACSEALTTSPSLRQCSYHDLGSVIRFDFSHQASKATTVGGPAPWMATRQAPVAHRHTAPGARVTGNSASRHATTALG